MSIFCRILTALLFVSSALLRAQVQIHKNINIEDGLVYSQVLFIHEDQKGYMWFGTSSGISRWDGINFKNFILPEKLLDNNCKWISEFSDGTLFFATRKGVVQYTNETFSEIPGTPSALNDWIHALLVTDNDELFIATDTAGVWIFSGKKFTRLESTNGISVDCIRALTLGADGAVYLGRSLDNMYVYKNGILDKIKIKQVTSNTLVNALFEDEYGKLWIGTEDQGVFIYDQEILKRISVSDGLPGEKITQITSQNSHLVFVATSDGLAVFENDTIKTVLNEKSGLSNNFVWYVNRDRNGLYYIGTDGGGVDVYRPGLFQTINTDCGLPHNTVWAICETDKQEFYFGTDKGLAKFKAGELIVYDKSSGLSDDMILTLYRASNGHVYMGTNEKGVDVLINGKFRNIGMKEGLTSLSVWTIVEDTTGLIYFGTYDGGIYVWDGERVIDRIDVNDGLPTNAIVSSFQSHDGSLFFGTDGYGVIKLTDRKIDSLFLPGNTIWSIHEDETQNLYFGTNDRGFIYQRFGIWDTLNVDQGLSHNCILGILQDNDGKFYLTADNGLNIIEFTPGNHNIRRIGQRDGLASNECNQGAYFKDSRGYLWFGTVNGVTRFDPDLYRPSKHSPLLHFTKFQLYDKEIPLGSNQDTYSFKYNENYFIFEFIGIDLSAPHKVEYRYRLSGIDRNWVQTKRPYVQYTGLNDNSYTFEVTAENEWGYRSTPRSITFTISPPFWERWWFILFGILVILSPLVVITYLRISRLLAMERLRAKIAADLHDDIGAGLSEINILTAVASAKTPQDLKSTLEPDLTKIGLTARSLIENMSDIVWIVNPKKDAVSDLVSRLQDSFLDMFEAKGISFRCDNAGILKNIRLKMEHRQHLFLIFKEAIHNALKYSKASELQLIINLKGKLLTVKLGDNGKGFDIHKAQKGNGLQNMQKRAEKIGGTCTISSQPGNGTEIKYCGKI